MDPPLVVSNPFTYSLSTKPPSIIPIYLHMHTMPLQRGPDRLTAHLMWNSILMGSLTNQACIMTLVLRQVANKLIEELPWLWLPYGYHRYGCHGYHFFSFLFCLPFFTICMKSISILIPILFILYFIFLSYHYIHNAWWSCPVIHRFIMLYVIYYFLPIPTNYRVFG